MELITREGQDPPLQSYKKASRPCRDAFCQYVKLQLGASGDQSLALVVAGVLNEVLLEPGSQILSLLFPDSGISVGISGIQDAAVNAGQSGGHFKVEVGDLLGLSLQDGAIQNGVDDAAGILNGDTLAGAVPAGVDQVSLAPDFSIFLTSSSPYLVGCSSRKAAPKQAEKVGVGSVMPRSVPASLEVKPDRK